MTVLGVWVCLCVCRCGEWFVVESHRTTLLTTPTRTWVPDLGFRVILWTGEIAEISVLRFRRNTEILILTTDSIEEQYLRSKDT